MNNTDWKQNKKLDLLHYSRSMKFTKPLLRGSVYYSFANTGKQFTQELYIVFCHIVHTITITPFASERATTALWIYERINCCGSRIAFG